MESKSRKKSINLILLIFILLLLIALIILIFFLFKHSKDHTENTENTVTNQENISVQLEVQTNKNNILQNSSGNNSIENNSAVSNINLNDIPEITEQTNESPTTSTSNKLTLNDHTFTFDNDLDISIDNSTSNPEIKIISNDFNYKMIFNTNNLMSFNTLKTNSHLKDYLTSTYNINITSAVKYGTVNNLEIIVCAISDNNEPAYFIITPLNSTEIAYTKIYNTSDTSKLISDLSVPVDELSKILSSLQ